MEFRIGQGIDVHQFASGRKLVLGGVEIPSDLGLIGHSDADALLHAIIDAILGAAGQSDIGTIFPDTDPQWSGISSLSLLNKAWQIVYRDGWRVVNIDSTVLTEFPKLKPFISEMKKNIANVLNVESSAIAIKAGTMEKMGFVGRSEGLMAQAIVLLSKA